MFAIARNAIVLEFGFALQHLPAKFLEIDLQILGLRQHLAFLFPDVVTNAFREHRELRLPMVVAPASVIQLGNQDTGEVMFLVGFVHQIRTDLGANGRIEDLFFDRGVNFQFHDRVPKNRFLLARRFRALESTEEAFHIVVVPQENRNRVLPRQEHAFEHRNPSPPRQR